MSGLDAAALLARLLQYLAVSVVGGASLFSLYGPTPARLGAFVRAAGILGALAAFGWLGIQAASLAAPVWTVATETGFGRAAALRVVLLAFAAAAPRRFPALLGLAAAASFAWSGHGAADEGAAGFAHQAADAIHLLAAAAWLGALAALLALALEPGAERLADGLRAFSRIGVWVVGVLVAGGLVNSLFLVGLSGLPTLGASLYGRLLIAKLGLFAAMLALAAVNRWRPARYGVRPLAAEALLGGLVLAAVAWMGMLPPPIHGA